MLLRTRLIEPCLSTAADKPPRGPKDDGTYVVEFRTAEDEALAISIPRSETAVIRHFQERMPYGLFVPELPSE